MKGIKEEERKRVMINISMICWAIWKERCNVMFKRKSLDVEGCMIKIKGSLVELVQVQETGEEMVQKEKCNDRERWTKPRAWWWWVKVNCDGAFK